MFLSLPHASILAAAVCFSVWVSASASAENRFSNSAEVHSGSPAGGILTDVNSNPVGYTVSTTGPLFFGGGGSDEASDLGGAKELLGSVDRAIDWISALSFDASIAFVQTPVQSTDGNFARALTMASNAISASVDPAERGLGSDGLVNSNSISGLGGNANAVATPGINPADRPATFAEVQAETVRYEPTESVPAVFGAEWLTFPEAEVLAVPEPAASVVFALIVAGICAPRRRAR